MKVQIGKPFGRLVEMLGRNVGRPISGLDDPILSTGEVTSITIFDPQERNCYDVMEQVNNLRVDVDEVWYFFGYSKAPEGFTYYRKK